MKSMATALAMLVGHGASPAQVLGQAPSVRDAMQVQQVGSSANAIFIVCEDKACPAPTAKRRPPLEAMQALLRPPLPAPGTAAALGSTTPTSPATAKPVPAAAKPPKPKKRRTSSCAK